jgi:hypothetical protein
LSIGHPEFDAFLSAPADEDAEGVGPSVMSALARIGLDPWSEAARLSDLPSDAAVEALALMLGKLPAGSGQPADDRRSLAERARRLADCLPVKAAGQPAGGARSQPAARTVSGPLLWLFYAAIAVGFYFLFSQLQPERQLEPAPSRTTQQ